jgi:hypothetical protein
MGWVANATPRLLYPLETDPVPITQDAPWASGPVWKGMEISPLGYPGLSYSQIIS